MLFGVISVNIHRGARLSSDGLGSGEESPQISACQGRFMGEDDHKQALPPAKVHKAHQLEHTCCNTLHL